MKSLVGTWLLLMGCWLMGTAMVLGVLEFFRLMWIDKTGFWLLYGTLGMIVCGIIAALTQGDLDHA